MKRYITKDDVKIFKGKYYLPWFKKDEVVHFQRPKKVIVLDLDETLGSFADLYILWCGIRQVWPYCNKFEDLCELYPEFLRYGILTILEYLYDKKLRKECQKIFIYTNNQCSSEWVHMISKFLEKKVKESIRTHTRKRLFDKMICAFKINNKTIEMCRTGHGKKYNDFLRCSLISENADICFIDDVEYPDMKSAKVYYICPRPYVHYLSTSEIIKRIIKAPWVPDGILTSSSFWKDWFYVHKRRYARRGKCDIELDLQVSHKIIHHLREFMLFGMIDPGKGKRNTRKHRKHSGNARKTRKLLKSH